MAVENDYNLLVHNLNELADALSSLRDEVEQRRVQGAREHLAPNQTDWINLIGVQLIAVDHIFSALRTGISLVLDSRPGEPVFKAQPPPAPDAP